MMDDFSTREKNVVRELSCRLCLATDVTNLKPLSTEMKRKIRKLFNVDVRNDDDLPKAICHDCLQLINDHHRFTIKVEKVQNFLEFHTAKTNSQQKSLASTILSNKDTTTTNSTDTSVSKSTADRMGKLKRNVKRRIKSPIRKRDGEKEYLPLDEFMRIEGIQSKDAIESPSHSKSNSSNGQDGDKNKLTIKEINEVDRIDSVVLIDGKPAKHGLALDRQITLFYRMECGVCKATGFHFRSLMKHYKDRHGVPGYVTCCDKKFHYFYMKKIVEHMAYHLQPNIFACPSCHENFCSSAALHEHTLRHEPGRAVPCPRCSRRFADMRQLGCHLVHHRDGKPQCDYCGKWLKHHHRRKTIYQMENVILCSRCTRTLKLSEKQAKLGISVDDKNEFNLPLPPLASVVENSPPKEENKDSIAVEIS